MTSQQDVFKGIDQKYKYYHVDSDGMAFYTVEEPKLSKRGDFWGCEVSMKDARNFNLHTDWKDSLIKRDD